MALTQITIALTLMFSAAFVSILIGAIGMRKAGDATIISIIVFGAFVPMAMYLIYLNLEIYATVLDWPVDSGSFLGLWRPLNAILIASWIGGFLGMISGKYWAEDDRSCLQCLMGPFFILVIVSLAILALP